MSQDSWPLKPFKATPTRSRVHNPDRPALGQMTELEQEIQRLAREGVAQQRIAYTIKHYEYRAPFNYPNARCELGREGTGTGPHPEGMELDIPPFSAVTIEEEEPIIAADVIGSPCIPPGTVLLFGEPLEWRFARPGVRFKVNNLWGEHLIGWGVSERYTEGNRHSGLCSAHFEIPDCRKITVTGYGQLDVHVFPPGSGIKSVQEFYTSETGEQWCNDAHFNLYAVRVTVRVPVQE